MAGVRAVFEDPRDHKAIEVLFEHLQSAEDDDKGDQAFSKAVQHLVDNGVRRAEAEPNLAMNLQAMMQDSPAE